MAYEVLLNKNHACCGNPVPGCAIEQYHDHHRIDSSIICTCARDGGHAGNCPACKKTADTHSFNDVGPTPEPQFYGKGIVKDLIARGDVQFHGHVAGCDGNHTAGPFCFVGDIPAGLGGGVVRSSFGNESPQMEAAVKFVKKEDERWRERYDTLGRNMSESLAKKDREIAALTKFRDELKDEFLDGLRLRDEEVARHDSDAERLLRRCRPYVNDAAGSFIDARYLAQDIKKLLEPEAAKAPSVADKCLPKAFVLRDYKPITETDRVPLLQMPREVVDELRKSFVESPTHYDLVDRALATQNVVNVSCVRCGGRWAKLRDVPEPCVAEPPVAKPRSWQTEGYGHLTEGG